MATISHKNLSGAQLHENKGVSSATDGQVATASSGATSWTKLTAANLQTTGNPFGAQLFHVRDERTSGTSGLLWTNSTWTTLTLQTTKTNEISSASLSSNQIILPAGTYRVSAQARSSTTGASSTMKTAIRFRNITAGSTSLTGPGQSFATTSNCNFTTTNSLFGTVTIAGSTTFEIQGWMNGGAASIPISSGEVEVYTEVLVWKIL